MHDRPHIASWLELDAAAFEHNVAVFRATLAGTGARLGGVLKGDAYGHGFDVSLPLVHGLVDVIYVITPGDALAIRDWERAAGASPKEVLVIGPVDAHEAMQLAGADIAVVLGDDGWSRWVDAMRAARCEPLKVHVHIDTGLGREGWRPERIAHALAGLPAARDVLRPVGVLTHFADTEDVTEQTYARAQLARFDEGVAALRSLLPGVTLQRHTAASAAVLVLPESRLDTVRVGISLYGLWPSRETRISTRLVRGELPDLRPVLSWRCHSQIVKALPEGSYVGYGRTHRCNRPTTVAVLPVGYHDGYPRLLSNQAHVLVRGKRCPVLGRVMMNHVVVDVTGAAAVGERVVATLLGRDGDEVLPAETLAVWAQTIEYELVTRIGAHLARVVVGDP